MTLQRLNEHLNMVLELQGAEERLSSMRSQILSAVNYDGMPHGHEVSRNTENLAILLQNQIDDVNRLRDRKSTRLNSSHIATSRMPSSA